MKKLLLTLLILISSLYTYSQCNVEIYSDSVAVDTLKICLGDSIDLYAIGNCNYFMYNDFNNGTVGTGWYSNATPMFNNPCPPLLPPASGIVCWIGSATNFPRELATVAYNVAGVGCTIEFDMKYGDIQTSVNCEDPDEPDEGVWLQYSIDGAVTWNTINYWVPNSTISGPLYTWTHYLENIPAAAHTPATQFRWWQIETSGFEWDHWGIDNVEIKCASNQIVNWSTGHTVFDPPPIYPTQSMIVTCYVMNMINGDFAIDTIWIDVGEPSPNAGNDTIICYGDSAYLNVTANNPVDWLWSNGSTTQSIIVSPIDTSLYFVTVMDYIGCTDIDSVQVIKLPVLSPPDLRCVDVLLNGDIILTWLPIDTSQCFNGYLIYNSMNINGPYNVIDTVFDINTLNYTHIGANGQNQYNYYFLQILNGTNNTHTLSSDTLQSMLINVANNNNITAELNWNSINNEPGIYYITREYPKGIFTLVDSTNLLNYSDTITLCGDSAYYYVQIYDSSGCVSTSSISGDYFWTYPPITPILDSVSVDDMENTVIGWQRHPMNNISGYLIYRYESGIWLKLDTVWGVNTTMYVDTSSNPCYFSESYYIAAFDSCGSLSPIGFNNIHHTIDLKIEDIDPCSDFVRLRWNRYINMDPPVLGYNIFVSIDDGTFHSVACTTYDTTCVYEGLNPESKYCYYVQAINSDGETSSSCIKCFYVNKPPYPNFIYLRYATIVDNDHVLLVWYNDTSEYARGYKILRSGDKSTPFEEIGYVKSTPSDPNSSFIDDEAYFEKKSYYYKIVVVDSCGLDILTSNIARTILLTGEPQLNIKNYLEWNKYEEWPWAFVDYYNVYRKVEGDYNIPVLISATDSIKYADDVSNYIDTEGKFSYYVEANEGYGISEFEDDISVSNVVNIRQIPMVYIPNAVSPKGYNKEFIPISIFTSKKDYLFVIYNRWGEELFNTDNPEIGWDGTFKGDYVPLGIYIYYVRFLMEDGKYFERRGTVAVIK